MVDCLTLSADASARVQEIATEARRGGLEADFLLVLSWLVPYRFALGDRAGAIAQVRSLGASAEANAVSFRQDDAEVFEVAARIPTGAGVAVDVSVDEAQWNARSRLERLRLREALWRGALASAPETIQVLDALVEAAPQSGLDSTAPYDALVRAHTDLDDLIEVMPPHQVYLQNLAGVLAGAEAVALAGTERHAQEWLRWLTQNLPSYVETSLEWPVSRRRVQALLALRAGNVAIAQKGMRNAIAWADQAGYAVEAAIARVQLGEMLAREEGRIAARDRALYRKEGAEALRALDIDPLPHALTGARALAAVKDDCNRPSLSAREAEVLRYLGDGYTYSQIAEALGVAAPTVHTLAHRAYGKLGVSGKRRAAAAARELGLI